MANPLALFEFDNDYLQILQKVEDQGGEITPEQEKLLDAIAAQQVQATGRYIELMSSIKHGEAYIDEWIAKWQHKKDQLQREKERWQAAMLQHCEQMDVTVEKAENGLVRVMKSESVEITGDVPRLYCRYIPEKYEPDKKAIKAAIEDGAPVDFARIVTRKRVQIY